MRAKIIWIFVTTISLVPRTVPSRQYLLNEWMNVIGVGGRVRKTQISVSENEYLWTRTGVFLRTKSCPEFFSRMQFIKLPRVLQKKDYSFQLPENSKGLQLLKRKSWQRWQHLIGKAKVHEDGLSCDIILLQYETLFSVLFSCAAIRDHGLWSQTDLTSNVFPILS